jgi:MFS family permease
VLNLPFKRVEHRIDYWGAALVMAAASSLILVTVWGGDQYAWGSPPIIALAVIGVLALIAFFVVEGRVEEPIIPLRLWRNPVFRVATGLEFLVGFAMFGGIVFLPLYLQTVGHASATNSGLLIMPLMLGLMTTSITSGRIITRTGRYKVFPVIGTALMAAGLYLLSTMGLHTSRVQSSLYMFVLGAGMGMIVQVMVLAVQNAVEHKDMGTATGVEVFSRSMGASFGVALYGAILNNRLAHYLPRLIPGGQARALNVRTLTASPAAIRRLPPPVQHGVVEALAKSLHVVFLFGVPFMVLAFFVVWFLRETPLRETAYLTVDEAGVEAAEGETVGGAGVLLAEAAEAR